MQLNLQTGIFDRCPPQSRRTLADIATIFRDQDEAKKLDPTTLVYETHGSPGEIEGSPRLLYATTVLQPGAVGDEYFMTRGHFHTRQDRGELMLTLKGEGRLLLMDRTGHILSESMNEGSHHDIDGMYAHRVVNVGEQPLVFYVAWMSDCGHDYDSIRANGFRKSMIRGERGPVLVPR